MLILTSSALLLVVLGATAVGLADLAPFEVSEIVIALVLGLGLGQVDGTSALRPGVARLAPLALKAGVALLGARLSLSVVLTIGGDALLVTFATMAATFFVIRAVAARLKLPGDLATLLALGMAVCGNSAIAAAAPVIGAQPRHIGYAIATVTIFGTCAVIAYPIVGAAVGMPSPAFGVWSGVSINDTSQVVAAGAAYSSSALVVATIVKLVRNAMIAPVLVLLAWRRPSRDATSTVRFATKAIPAFVVVFLLLSAARSAGMVTDDLASIASSVSAPLITAAIAGIGFSVRLSELKGVGMQPLALGLVGGIAVSVSTLFAVHGLGLGW